MKKLRHDIESLLEGYILDTNIPAESLLRYYPETNESLEENRLSGEPLSIMQNLFKSKRIISSDVRGEPTLQSMYNSRNSYLHAIQEAALREVERSREDEARRARERSTAEANRRILRKEGELIQWSFGKTSI